MQKFVVKKSKSAPLAATSLSQPSLQLKPVLCGAEKTVPQNATTAKLNSMESATVTCKSDATNNKPIIKTVTTTANATTTTSVMRSSQPPSTTVKMSGYLKKKRNVRHR